MHYFALDSFYHSGALLKNTAKGSAMQGLETYTIYEQEQDQAAQVHAVIVSKRCQ